MARIFISSTYEDLKAYRKDVYVRLTDIGHDVLAMEDYLASDKRSLERCLEDVRSCDIYVGIFAWRYGYIPPGETRSITECEYREAIRLGKECLIFLCEDGLSWPIKMTDQNRAQIEQLREELGTRHTCKFFSGVDQLGSAVVRSILNSRTVNNSRPTTPHTGRSQIGPDTHLYCDRDLQLDQFNALVSHSKQTRGYAFAIKGNSQDMPQSLVKRLCSEIKHLAKIYGREEDSVSQSYEIKWPSMMPELHRKRVLLAEIIKTLGHKIEISLDHDQPSNLAAILSERHEKIIVLSHYVDLDQAVKEQKALLEWYLNYWGQVAGDLRNVQIILFFSYIEPHRWSSPKYWLWDLIGRSSIREVQSLIPSQYPELSSNQPPVFIKYSLPKLELVKMKDVVKWMREYKVFSEEERENEAKKIVTANTPMPMQHVQAKLKNLLS